jgi:hypothetical protein
VFLRLNKKVKKQKCRQERKKNLIEIYRDLATLSIAQQDPKIKGQWL